MSESNVDWYLVRTKANKERLVCDQLEATVPEVILPLLKVRTPRWGKLAWSIGPLFPGYLFARFDISTKYFEVKYMVGVRGLVSAGAEPLTVPLRIIEEIRRRTGADGIVEMKEEPLSPGDRVEVANGPFKGFEAIFERYLSGAERVAILLGTVEANGLRVVLPASSLARRS